MRRLSILAAIVFESGAPRQLTTHATAVTQWQFSPDSKRIYFLSPASVDKDT